MSKTDLEQAISVLQRPLTLNIDKHISPQTDPDSHRRPSDVIRSELASHKELFAKLRFLYTKQVEKEHILSSLTSSDPQTIDFEELSALEAETALDKAALSEQKARVAALLVELETSARRVAQRHETLKTNIDHLARQPRVLSDLTDRVETLRSSVPSAAEPSTDPELNLSLAETNALINQRMHELEQTKTRFADLQEKELPRKQAQVDTLRDQVNELAKRRDKVLEDAQGGEGILTDDDRAAIKTQQELEHKARLLIAKTSILSSLLQV